MVISLAGAAFASKVPWRYREGGAKSVWSWQTSAFLAVIVLAGGQWLWEVSVNGNTVLAAGAGTDFDECEQLALETVGKAFPAHSGYGHLTDAAAAHYRLADGVRYDLGDLDGMHVQVDLDTGDSLVGTLGVGDWWLHLTSGERTVDIHPAHVLRVQSPYLARAAGRVLV